MSLPVYSQEQDEEMGGFFNTRILFVFDASQSMAGYWESDQKINIARDFPVNVIDSLENLKNVRMALRVYGHQSPVPPQDCRDSKLEVPFDVNNAFRPKNSTRLSKKSINFYFSQKAQRKYEVRKDHMSVNQGFARSL